jgi:hypothetical protein
MSVDTARREQPDVYVITLTDAGMRYWSDRLGVPPRYLKRGEVSRKQRRRCETYISEHVQQALKESAAEGRISLQPRA